MNPQKAPQSAFDFSRSSSNASSFPRPEPYHSPAAEESKKRQKPDDDLEFVESMDAFIQESRTKLSELLDLILSNSPLKYSYHSYATLVESHCRLKSEERSRLTQAIYSKLDTYFQGHTQPELTKILESIDENKEHTIQQSLIIFEDWESKLKLIRKLFLYLDRSYLLNHQTKKQVLNYGMDLLIDAFFGEDRKSKCILLDLHTDVLAHYRKQEEEYPDILKQYSKTLLKLNYGGVLSFELTHGLIEQIIRHFNVLKLAWWDDPEEYLTKVVHRASKEKEFFIECGYSKSFINNLIIKLHWNLIFEDFKTFISSTLPYILDPQDSFRLKSVYSWCESSKRIFELDSMSMFIYEWGQMVYNEVLKTIETQNSKNSKVLVQNLVDLFAKYNRIVQDSLSNNERFEFELRTSFTNAFVKRPNNNTVIFQLAKYCDTFFKALTKKSSSDISFEEFKSNVLTVFKCINNKQDFIIPYKRDLSRRLLLARVSNFDQEKELADSIMDLVGAYDSNGLDVLFKDFNISKSTYTNLVDGDAVLFDPLVLDKSKWTDIPRFESETILPNTLSSILAKFEDEFQKVNERHRNKKLDWSNYSLHQLTIQGEFDSGPKELLVNMLQAVVILLFNDNVSYSFSQIQDRTKIESKLLTRVLSSLSTEKYKILESIDETYRFNHQFTDKSYRIRLPLSKDLSSKPLKRQTEVVQQIERNRKDEFASVVMKIMKEYKQLTATALLTKAIEILEKRNPVSIIELKESIDHLIDKEYIERVDTTNLRYLP